MSRRLVGFALLLATAFITATGAQRGTVADPAYTKEVEAWRLKHEEDYTRQYVPLAGLFFLKPGANTIGSAPSSAIPLPARAPQSIGQVVWQGDRFRFEPRTGVSVTMNGTPVTSAVEMRPASATTSPDELAIGDITFWIHPSGDRRAVRLRDPQSDVAKGFQGYRWFPIDSRYRVVGRIIRDAQPREWKIPSLIGDFEMYTTEGVVEFTLNGAVVRLRPMTTRPGRLFFIFRDATAGTETYEAARFLYADLNLDGTVVLDFNMAYNPPCAFNPYTTCPLPPPENRIAMRIPAGELNYAKPVKLP